MSNACPAAPPDVHLVHALLRVTDCQVRALVHTGYDGLFQSGGSFASVLTTLMTLYVALIGYQLMLGRGGLRIGDVTLSVVKLAAILSFATQWDTYQAIVVRVLFDGTAQIATAMLHLDSATASGGDIFDRLQRAFDILSAAPTPPVAAKPAGPLAALPPLAALQSLPLLGGGVKVLALKAAAAMLLFFSLGLLLATKVVLGVLLAIGAVAVRCDARAVRGVAARDARLCLCPDDDDLFAGGDAGDTRAIARGDGRAARDRSRARRHRL